MKNIWWGFIMLMMIISMISAQDEGFDVDRLPLGDVNKKYDFSAVKLDKIFSTAANREISYDNLIASLAKNRIVMVGETHTDQNHHDVQLDIIKGLTEAGKKVCLALEMFNPSQNEALLAWTSGKSDEETFLMESGFFNSWGHNYRYYRSIFMYAKENNIPISGVNSERKYASKIGKVGLDGLTQEEREAIPEVDTSNTEHKFFFKVAMQGMDATMPSRFKNIYPAQCLWDAAMGEGAIEVAKKNPDAVVVVLAGSGHVIYNFGIGRIIRARSDLSFESVVTVDVPEEIPESTMMKVQKDIKKEGMTDKKAGSGKQMPAMKIKPEDGEKSKKMPPKSMIKAMGKMDQTPYKVVIRSLADYLWGKKELEQEKYPAFGITIVDSDDGEGYLVKRVLPNTIASENGFTKGDIIIAVDNKKFESNELLKKYLHFKNWNDEIKFQIKREDKNMKISFVIEPVEE